MNRYLEILLLIYNNRIQLLLIRSRFYLHRHKREPVEVKKEFLVEMDQRQDKVHVLIEVGIEIIISFMTIHLRKILVHSFKILMEHSLLKQKEIIRLHNKAEVKHLKISTKQLEEITWTNWLSNKCKLNFK